MAAQSSASNTHANPYLSRNQQDLLYAALNSQAGNSHYPIKRSSSDPENPTMSALNGNALFMSPQNAELDNFDADLDYNPDMDFLDDSGFDFENADLGGEMIGALPGRSAGTENTTGDGHEKRKSPDDAGEGEEGDAKRQETQEGEKGGAKKPGRKPLTNEPTTVGARSLVIIDVYTDERFQKRKAQNRAAQRAFRERKEKHLKDLETKVTELSKAQEADKHENGLLKAQVERLQVELREYRTRLSLNSASANRSPSLAAIGSQKRGSSASSYGGNFNFEFPKFGALPGSQMFPTQGFSNGPSPTSSIQDSTSMQAPTATKDDRSQSPRNVQASNSNSSTPAATNINTTFAPYSTNSNMHGFASTLPQMSSASDPFGDLFSPGLLKNANHESYFENSRVADSTRSDSQPRIVDNNGGDSTAGLNRVFQFNGGSSSSDSTSPSNSSGWNVNTGNSSCGTSPAPSHDSPAIKDKSVDSFPTKQHSTGPTFANSNLQNDVNASLTDYNVPSLGSFDPVLFGDYRESNDAIVGGGNFTGGFFDDALMSAPFDFNSPSNLFGILQSPQQSNATIGSAINAPTPSRNLMAEVEKTRDGEDDKAGLPIKTEGTGKMISCNNIW